MIIYIIVLHDVLEKVLTVCLGFFLGELYPYGGWFKWNTNMSISWPFSAGCIMSDHVWALYTFLFSQSKTGYFQIIFFNWDFLSKFIELMDWDTKQRSSNKRYRRTLRLWRNHAMLQEHCEQIRTSKKALTVLACIAVFAAAKREPCTLY